MGGMKTVILIIGSNGVGKTTQSRELITAFSEGEQGVEVRREKIYYTVYPHSDLIVLGKMGKNACTGLDSVYSQLGAEGVSKSLKAALEDKHGKLIIVECIFATIAWYNRWVTDGLRNKFKLLVVHLELSMWENFKRIQERRAKKVNRKDWYNISLEDTVFKNVGSKNRETRNIFWKFEGIHETSKDKLADATIQIPAVNDKYDIHKDILKFLYSNL